MMAEAHFQNIFIQQQQQSQLRTAAGQETKKPASPIDLKYNEKIERAYYTLKRQFTQSRNTMKRAQTTGEGSGAYISNETTVPGTAAIARKRFSRKPETATHGGSSVDYPSTVARDTQTPIPQLNRPPAFDKDRDKSLPNLMNSTNMLGNTTDLKKRTGTAAHGFGVDHDSSSQFISVVQDWSDRLMTPYNPGLLKTQHQNRMLLNKQFQGIKTSSLLKKQKLALNYESSFTNLQHQSSSTQSFLQSSSKQAHILQSSSLDKDGLQRTNQKPPQTADTSLTMQKDISVEILPKGTLVAQRKFERFLHSIEDDMDKYEMNQCQGVRVSLSAMPTNDIEKELTHFRNLLQGLVSHKALGQLIPLAHETFKHLHSRLLQAFESFHSAKLKSLKFILNQLQQEKLTLLQEQHQMIEQFALYKKFYQEEILYRDDLFKRLPALHQMMEDYQKMGDLGNEESRLKKDFQHQYDQLRELKVSSVEEFFGHKDPSAIQSQIYSLNQKLSKDLMEVSEEHQIGHSNVNQELADVLFKLQGKTGFIGEIPLEVILTATQENKSEELLEEMMSRLTAVQVETVRRLIARLGFGLSNTHESTQVNLPEEQRKAAESRQVAFLTDEVQTLEFHLEKEKIVTTELREENRELNHKFAKINHKHRSLVMKHNELEEKHSLVLVENKILNNQNHNYESKLDEVNKSYKTIQQKLNETTDRLKGLRSDKVELTVEIDTLKVEVKDVQERLEQTIIEKKDLQQEVVKLHHEIQEEKKAAALLEEVSDDDSIDYEAEERERKLEEQKAVRELLQEDEKKRVAAEKEKEKAKEREKVVKLQNKIMKKKLEEYKEMLKKETEARKVAEEAKQQMELDRQNASQSSAASLIEMANTNNKTSVHITYNNSKPQLSSQTSPTKQSRVYKDSKGVQVPDTAMLHTAETLRQLNKKEFTNRLLQTDDLVEEELLKQLKEWRQARGVKIFASSNRNRDFPVFGSQHPSVTQQTRASIPPPQAQSVPGGLDSQIGQNSFDIPPEVILEEGKEGRHSSHSPLPHKRFTTKLQPKHQKVSKLFR